MIVEEIESTKNGSTQADSEKSSSFKRSSKFKIIYKPNRGERREEAKKNGTPTFASKNIMGFWLIISIL